MKKRWMLVIAACLLTGCDSSEERATSTEAAKPGFSITLPSIQTPASQAVTAQTFYAPGKLDISVNDGTVETKWNAVTGATAYECTFEGAKDTYETEKCSFKITNAYEGTNTIKVRAIYDTKDGRAFSEWTSAKIDVPYTLGNPANMSITLDGSYLSLKWDEAKNADSYECIYTTTDGENTFAPDENHMGLRNVTEGFNYTFKIRGVRKTPTGTMYSDWIQGSYEVPVIDYSNVGYLNAVFLSENQLITWAKNRGYAYQIDEAKDASGKVQTVVSVHYKDELNSGFFNAAGRLLASAIVGFVGGYSEQLQDDYSSLEKIVQGYVDAGSLEEYANSFDANATQSGKEGAFAGAVNALLLDTDIYYQYYYDNTSKAADFSTSYFLMNQREDYEKNNFGDFKKSNDGSYHLTNNYFKKDYNVTVTSVTSNGFQKWAVIAVPQ